jgi:hypothetical protein
MQYGKLLQMFPSSHYTCWLLSLGSLLKTNATVHLKVSVNLLVAETIQPNRNQSDCAHKWMTFETY